MEPPQPPPPPELPPAPTEAPADAAPPDLGSLAPDFDPEAPLGIPGLVPPPEIALTEPGPPVPDPTRARRPAPRPDTEATVEPEAAPSAPAAGERRLRGRGARRHRPRPGLPAAARDRGIVGTARIKLTIARNGRLIEARLLQSSGSPALDAASLAAARTARLPAGPGRAARRALPLRGGA